MKFAVVGEERREAQPHLSGKCPVCGNAMIAKCGNVRVRHWAHRGIRTCDLWWEPETPWHRDWKNKFPEDWQEIIHQSEDGEKHIADVKTKCGVVIEFQHSHLRRKERKSRENFYPKMVWVVDGRSRKRDAERFFRSLDAARVINGKPLTVSVPSDEGALLRRWVGCHSAVFFDFGDNSEPVDPPSFGGPVLWRLDPHNPRYEAHLLPVLKTSFLDTCLNGLPLRGIDYSAELSVPRLEAWIRSKWRDYPRNFWRDNTFGAILRQRQAMSA